MVRTLKDIIGRNERNISNVESSGRKQCSGIRQAARRVTPDIPDIDDFPWIEHFGESRMVLMPQSPCTLFVYWEIDQCRQGLVARHFGCAWPEAPKVMRVYDVTRVCFNGCNSPAYLDITVGNDAEDWYIRGVQSGRTYCVDYGIKTPGGGFFTVLRSNPVKLPQDRHGLRGGERHRETKQAESRGQGKAQGHRQEHDCDKPSWPAGFDGYSSRS